MEIIKYIAAIDLGGYTCVAVGGNTVVQLVVCLGSSEILLGGWSSLKSHTQKPSAWTQVGALDRPRPTAFSSGREVDVSSLNWCKGPDGQLTLVASYVYHGVV